MKCAPKHARRAPGKRLTPRGASAEQRNALRRSKRKMAASADQQRRELVRLIAEIREDIRSDKRLEARTGVHENVPEEWDWEGVVGELEGHPTYGGMSVGMLKARHEEAVQYVKANPPKRSKTAPRWSGFGALALLEAMDFVEEEYVGPDASWKTKLAALYEFSPDYRDDFESADALKARYADALRYLGYPKGHMKRLRNFRKRMRGTHMKQKAPQQND
jgi:hypothetical protein